MRYLSDPKAGNEQREEPEGEIRRLLTYASPYRGRLVLGMISLLVASALSLIGPQLIRRMLDAAFIGFDQEKVNYYLKFLCGIYLLQAAFSFVRTYLFSYVGERIVADLRRQLHRHLLRLSMSFFAENRVGELTSRHSSDVTLIQTAASASVIELIRNGLIFVGCTLIIAVTNLRMTVFMLSVVPPLMICAMLFGRYLRRQSIQVQDALATANGALDETLAGVRTVQSFVREEYESARYGSHIEGAFAAGIKRSMASGGFMAFITFTIFTGVGLVLWYGARLVIWGEMTAGEMMAFLIYTFYIAMAVGGVAEIYGQFQQARGASRRVFELLDLKPEIADRDDARPLGKVEGFVELDGVGFAYSGGDDAPVLKEINLSARPGEVVALVGPSGAGKTTLVNLIPRFYDVSEGEVRVDGHDVRSLRLSDLRQHVGIVPQETLLFSGTVYDNIAYGNLGASAEAVERATRAAHAHDFIRELPQGYQTLVGERGVKLSGGQRQRIAIARALLKDPAILILDEATSALDSESERLVQAALERLMQGRTTFVIAHRLSTVCRADRIAVLEAGRIVAEGSHRELVEQGGLYSQLCDLQFNLGPTLGKEVQEYRADPGA
ncbi:MAG: ABC transporter ATP-binding protein [Pyrinomonadaceae bacterium]